MGERTELPLPLKLPTVTIKFYIESRSAKKKSLVSKMFHERGRKIVFCYCRKNSLNNAQWR